MSSVCRRLRARGGRARLGEGSYPAEINSTATASLALTPALRAKPSSPEALANYRRDVQV